MMLIASMILIVGICIAVQIICMSVDLHKQLKRIADALERAGKEKETK